MACSPRIDVFGSSRPPAADTRSGIEVVVVLKSRTLIFGFAWKLPAHELQRLLAIFQAAFQLGVFQSGKNLFEFRARPVAGSNQVVPGEQGARAHLVGGRGFKPLFHKVVEREIAVAGKAVNAVQFQVLGGSAAGA